MTKRRIFVRASLLILMAIFGYLGKGGLEGLRDFYFLRDKLVPQVATISHYSNSMVSIPHYYKYTFAINDQTFTGSHDSIFGGSASTFFSRPKEGEKLRVLYRIDDPIQSYLTFFDTNFPEFLVEACLISLVSAISFVLCLLGTLYPDEVPL